jgi:hypothetical protein
MRSHGVPSFPDPGPGRNGAMRFDGHLTPAEQAAQNSCASLLPGPGPARSGPPPAALVKQTLAVAECMRAHGVSGFPDPTTTPPSSLADNNDVSTQDGVSFVIPSTINVESPTFKQAATACNFSDPPGHGG